MGGMNVEQIVRLTFEELRRVEFQCPHCSTAVTYDASTVEPVGTPAHCPTCRIETIEIARLMAQYRDLRNAVLRANARLSLIA